MLRQVRRERLGAEFAEQFLGAARLDADDGGDLLAGQPWPAGLLAGKQRAHLGARVTCANSARRHQR